MITLPDTEIARDVAEVPNGFLVAGQFQVGGGGAPEAMLAKFDLSGNLDSGHPVRYAAPNGRYLTAMTTLAGGEVLSVGVGAPQGDGDLLLLRSDVNGQASAGFPVAIGTRADEFALAVAAIPGGGAVIAGQSEGDALLSKVDETGIEEAGWPQTSPVNGDDAYNRVLPTPDGGYVVCGYRGSSLYFAKLNASGSL